MSKRSHPRSRAAWLVWVVVAVLAAAGVLLGGALFAGKNSFQEALINPVSSLLESVTSSLRTSGASASLRVYFTNPASPDAAKFTGGPDEALARAIRGAKTSVDVAAYSLSLYSVRDALIEAHQRGVRVRLVMESDNMETQTVEDLRDAGIPMLGDRTEGLMHNKFMVIDNKEVWTGSMNYSIAGTYADNNNVLRLRSTRIAKDYATEFEEMFTSNHFGPDTVPATPYPEIGLGGGLVEVYFSPDDGVSKRLVELLNSADKSIYFLAYSFTSDDLAQAVIARFKSGVTVSGVFDSAQVGSNLGTEYPAFKKLSMDVRLDGNPGQMHHKVLIIDEAIVVLGSYNFSASAERNNDENLLVLHNPKMAKAFIEEFKRIYAQALP